MATTFPTIYTVGHSNLPLDRFVARLRDAGIEAVVDVRSRPVCRYAPHFSQPALSRSLAALGVRYAWLGASLGGRPANERYYDGMGRVLYHRVARDRSFLDGLRRVTAAAGRHRLALICAEGEPTRCHRHILIGRVLVEQGWPREAIVHIDARGQQVPYMPAPRQSTLFGQDTAWRSQRSVLLKVRPSIFSNDSGTLASVVSLTFA